MRRNLVLSACVAVGLIIAEVAMAIEEPAFEVLEKAENIEIRHYPPVIVAETFVKGDMDSASSSGFRLIADYIFGNNQSPRASAEASSEKIAMTAPVSVEPVARSQKIAMTAPVSVEPLGDSKDSLTGMKEGTYWRVQFTMPGSYSMASLPKPLNPAVTLREIPGKRYAVLVFSGLAGEEKAQQKTDELRDWLKARNLSAIATPQLARYNPPWTLPFFRRNEILIEIAVP
jgi:hypothetical protein